MTGRHHAYASAPDPLLGSFLDRLKAQWGHPDMRRWAMWYGGAVVTGAVIALCVLAGGGR